VWEKSGTGGHAVPPMLLEGSTRGWLPNPPGVAYVGPRGSINLTSRITRSTWHSYGGRIRATPDQPAFSLVNFLLTATRVVLR